MTSVPKVSAEQRKAWTVAPYEMRQLLVCRDSAETGFVTGIIGLPAGDSYVQAGNFVTRWALQGDAPEQILLRPSAEGKQAPIISIARSADGKLLAVGDSEGKVIVWNTATWQEVVSKSLYKNDVVDLSFSTDGALLASISYDKEVSIWDAQTLAPKQKFAVNTNGLKTIEFVGPSRLLVAGESITSWDTNTAKQEQQLSSGRYYSAMSRSQDGKLVAFADRDGLHVWTTEPLQSSTTLNGEFATNELIAFSPDGNSLVTANGAEVRIWDLASGRLLQVIDAYGPAIVGLQWLPESDLIAVASENGRTRVWGTGADGQRLKLTPIATTAAEIDPAAHTPMTLSQINGLIDVRTMPRLPDANSARLNGPTDLAYETSSNVDEVKLFHRFQLNEQGWTEVAAAQPTPNSIDFQKSGCVLSVSVYEVGPGKTNVNVRVGGNYDVRWAPQADVAPKEMVYENANTLIYRIKAPLPQVEAALIRALHQAGFTLYSRLHTSQAEQADRRDLEFIWNSTVLGVTISTMPEDPSTLMVQYVRRLESNPLPIPRDSAIVEYFSSTAPSLVAITAMKIDEAQQFLDQSLRRDGWLGRQVWENKQERRRWLPFVQGQRDLLIGLVQLDSGKTLIRVGDDVEKSSWQLAKPADQEKSGSDSSPGEGIEAADLASLLSDAEAKFDAMEQRAELKLANSTLQGALEQTAKALQTAGWELKSGGIRDEEYTFVTFKKGNREIDFRARKQNGVAVIDLQGSGLLWNKPLPGPEQVVSYLTWLKKGKHPATLELLDQFVMEMMKPKGGEK